MPRMAKVGDRIELVSTSDPYTALQAGDQGTITMIDAWDTVHVRWDSGSTLGLVPGEDRFRLVKETKLVLDDENPDEPLTRERV